MVIVGIMASVGVVKYERFTKTAIENEFYIALRELNVRESLHFFDARLSDTYIDDENIFDRINFDLGAARWRSGPASTGGQLQIQGAVAVLSRAESSRAGPAQWTK